MRRGALLVAVVTSGALALTTVVGPAGAAGNWTVGLHASSSGEAHAQALPSAPTASSACASPATGKKVTVTWGAITHATGYGVYQSTTSATGTYTLQTTVTTTSWTSAVLSTGNYWYEVVANIGSNWASAKSSATAQRTISSTTCS
jgi:hypothetical protein